MCVDVANILGFKPPKPPDPPKLPPIQKAAPEPVKPPPPPKALEDENISGIIAIDLTSDYGEYRLRFGTTHNGETVETLADRNKIKLIGELSENTIHKKILSKILDSVSQM